MLKLDLQDKPLVIRSKREIGPMQSKFFLTSCIPGNSGQPHCARFKDWHWSAKGATQKWQNTHTHFAIYCAIPGQINELQGCGAAVGVAGIVRLWTSSKRLYSEPEKSWENSGHKLLERSWRIYYSSLCACGSLHCQDFLSQIKPLAQKAQQ